jgi:UDP-glucose 4-epimerase
VLDDFSSGSESNLAACAERVEVRRGDICDPLAVREAVEDVEVVFHQAAIASVPRSVADPIGTDAVNVGGTLRVLEAARRAGVRRVVFAASSAVYGNGGIVPSAEHLLASPESPYALQKHTGELYCALYHRLYGLEAVALRYFNVFGPRQDPNSDYAAVIPAFAAAAVAGRPPVIYGDGEQTRDFVYVDNVVRANLLAAAAPRASGAVVNVAAGVQTSLNALWTTLRDILGIPIEPSYEAVREGDVRVSVADLRCAGELLGYEATVDLAEGLRRTLASLEAGCKSNEGRLR